jgi:hypothetical protein
MNDQFGSKMINLRVAYMDVGEGREQERKLCETQAIAGLLLAFRALISIILNPNLIRPDLCRGSLIQFGLISSDGIHTELPAGICDLHRCGE